MRLSVAVADPAEFVAVTVKFVDASVVDGVPVIAQVVVFNDNPDGSAGEILQLDIAPPELVAVMLATLSRKIKLYEFGE
jgi:hypothetical protein